MTDLQAAYPPDYIKLPSAIACADEDDAVLITMARVLGLCWGYKYRKSPPYTPDQLADLLGRPRTTLYRHLEQAPGPPLAQGRAPGAAASCCNP